MIVSCIAVMVSLSAKVALTKFAIAIVISSLISSALLAWKLPVRLVCWDSLSSLWPREKSPLVAPAGSELLGDASRFSIIDEHSSLLYGTESDTDDLG